MGVSVVMAETNPMTPSRTVSRASQRGMGNEAVRTLSSLETMSDKQIAWSTNFYVFCFGYAMSFDATLSSFEILNYILDHEVLAIGTGILMLIIVIMSIPAGTVVALLGPKKSQLLAMSFPLLYFVAVAAAAFVGKENVSAQWFFYLVAAFGCGLAVALLGAASGPWVDRTADILCAEDPVLNRSEVSAYLLSDFQIISSAYSVFYLLMMIALMRYLDFTYPWVTVVYAGFAILAIGLVALTRDPPAPATQTQKVGSKESIKREIRAAANYYKNPRAWFLAIPALTIGIMSAWRAFDIGNILEEPGSIDINNAPAVNLAQSFTQMVCAKLFSRLIPRFGTNPVMGLGTVGLLAAPCLALFTNLAYDGWYILIFYCLAGLSWSVMGTAFKAIILDHFKDDQAGTAFAAYNSQTFIGQVIFYFLAVGGSDTMKIKEICIVIFAVLVMPSVFIADSMKAKEETGPELPL